jgi:hypothetical protein
VHFERLEIILFFDCVKQVDILIENSQEQNMTNIVKAIQDLYKSQAEKVEQLRKLINFGIRQEDFDSYELKSLNLCHKAAQEALDRNLVDTFGKSSEISPLDFILKAHTSDISIRKRKHDIPSYFCLHEGCNKSFVNAGNLKNHEFAHDRELKLRASVLGLEGVEGAGPLLNSSKAALTKYKRILKNNTGSINTDTPNTLNSSAEVNQSSSSSSGFQATFPVIGGEVNVMDAFPSEDGLDNLNHVLDIPTENLITFNADETEKRRSGNSLGGGRRNSYTVERKQEILQYYDALMRESESFCLLFTVW